ncbi:uncharacterized protein BDW43DRAFT_316099 [Aspergillus alliaceus]|uniref:uncharacterized protein n=1 Tax=Petromyces alliaceus TaxID=209559 RepID=UPI0012A4CA1A|nr:uncharacterized protein BDW43DRAFT_316099 [Aspergillus alliaceus]KAB8228246.1 hypothetical protein BDW43DRAFT_316099 [Aspergillus alliaceus]
MFLTLMTFLWELGSPLAVRMPCHVQDAAHTFYGFPDNDPPGGAIAYDCGRGLAAGGVGTFNDPLTFASAPGEFDICETIYDPYLRKYLRMEDYCNTCTRNWGKRIWNIDVWTGSTTVNGGNDQLECENKLTPMPQHKPIIRRPGPDLPTDSTPLFVTMNKSICNVESIFHSYVAQSFC